MKRPILSQEEAPTVNDAVDLGNIVSLKYRVPVGAHDLDRLRGDFVVRVTREGEYFTVLGEIERGGASPARPSTPTTRGPHPPLGLAAGERGKVTPRLGTSSSRSTASSARPTSRFARPLPNWRRGPRADLGATTITWFVDAATRRSKSRSGPRRRRSDRTPPDPASRRAAARREPRWSRSCARARGCASISASIRPARSSTSATRSGFEAARVPGPRPQNRAADRRLHRPIGDPTARRRARSRLVLSRCRERRSYAIRSPKILDFDSRDQSGRVALQRRVVGRMTAKDMIGSRRTSPSSR